MAMAAVTGRRAEPQAPVCYCCFCRPWRCQAAPFFGVCSVLGSAPPWPVAPLTREGLRLRVITGARLATSESRAP